jgi:uncharacterized membrane protein
VSVRTYTPYVPEGRRRSPGPIAAALPWVLAALTVLAQIAYPLTDGTARDRLTVVTVVLFFLASVSHAAVWRGATWTAGFVAITVCFALLIEALGEATGFPFGSYDYAGSLGAKILGVPWVIPLAWTMMAYPALVVARRLSRGFWTTPLVAGFALASWDVFLDPQMTDAGHWTFAFPTPAPPFLDGVPWTNFAGWFGFALLLMAILDRLPRQSAPEGQPATLFLWTYVSSVVANIFFFDRPGVALVGGVVMGAVAIPYAWVLWSERA